MYILVITLLVIAAYAGFMLGRFGRYQRAARTAARTTQPFNQTPANAREHILVLGDSTMYGAGITRPESTIGGLLANKYPHATIETLAVNGAKVEDLAQQLAGAQHDRYDLIVIGVGGNDIVQFSNYRRLRSNLSTALRQASARTGHVVLCHSVNVGNIGFFVFPLNYLFDYRTRQLSKVYAAVTTPLKDVTYVNFYRPLHADHYDRQSRPEFIAGDAFHPSDYANQYFFGLLWQAIAAHDHDARQ